MLPEDYKEIMVHIPAVRQYNEELEKQDLWWTVVAMVGKINNQNIDPQLVESISEAQKQFSDLKTTLINNLTQRYIGSSSIKIKLKSQAFIDILNRNLFERTADVGYLSMDYEITHYLSQKDFSLQARQNMRQRLVEYINKYSVYDDVVLITPDFKIAVRIVNDCASSEKVISSPFINQAMNQNDFVECDQVIEGVTSNAPALTYLQKVTYKGELVGVLCLCFKLEDELDLIQKSLNDEDNTLTFYLIDKNKQLIYSNDNSALPDRVIKNTTLNKLKYLHDQNEPLFSFSTLAKGYQGFKGLPWQCLSIESVKESLGNLKESEDIPLNSLSSLFPKDLEILNLEINTALLIVILNGKIMSLKNKVKTFLPVLDSFQEIGEDIQSIFSSSISHIHKISYKTLASEVSLSAKLSSDIMDRNLYERANDCRWWALNTKFIESLSSNKDDFEEISNDLAAINNLYTVYTNLFIYNKSGIIVAVSNSDEKNIIGKDISKFPEVIETLKSFDSQKYAVSKFEKTSLYQGRSTYIYHAAIPCLSGKGNSGGIGIVFDSTPEFKAILDDMIPRDSKGEVYKNIFSVFLDTNQNIISVSENTLSIDLNTKLNLSLDVFTKKAGSNGYVMDTFNNIDYLIGYQVSTGYREYNSYKNNIITLVFVPC